MTSDISVLVKQKIDQLAADGVIDQLVSKTIEAAIAEAVNSALGKYSPFTSSIEKGIKETVKIDLKDLGIPGYNDLVVKILRQKLGAFFEATATKSIEESMAQLLAEFPQEITVSKLADMFREFLEDRLDPGEGGNFTFIVEPSDRKDGYFEIYIDEDDDKRKHACDYHIRCKDDGVWAMHIGGEDAKKKLFMGPLFNFERFLFHAYTNKTVIKLDTSEPETHYGYQD